MTRVGEDLKRAGLLAQVSKSDSMARHRLSSLPLVQVVIWLSEGSSVTSRERKNRRCDAKQLLPGSVRGTDWRAREGERGI